MVMTFRKALIREIWGSGKSSREGRGSSDRRVGSSLGEARGQDFLGKGHNLRRALIPVNCIMVVRDVNVCRGLPPGFSDFLRPRADSRRFPLWL